ncbi:MAG: short-chain dehydrogenase [SAR86 cluster bacterium]|uniref:Short-chain dehydrogenase n=1 Tax=SAR86 cluster bacterium TaxID=2030880 RepID=A0A2A4X6U8_9GAMM|nr:MAG: short-chain dehydrogenase [SAR86 cluster bacterium]
MSNSSGKKLVVITGASSGIGLALVKALLEEGYAVLGIANDFEKARLDHPGFSSRSINLADLDALPERMSSLLDEITMPVKAVINNAGIGRMGFLEQLSVKDIRLVMDTNITSQIIVTKAFLPLLKKQGEGDILFMGSEAALKGARQGSIYCASKFAVRGFSQALRDECGKSGVRVTLINPGAVRTPFFEKLQFEPELAAENAIEPEDIASTVSMVLAARPGTVFDEITLSPRNQVWKKKDA